LDFLHISITAGLKYFQGSSGNIAGTAGKYENNQVCVFLAYTIKRKHALLGRQLFVPKFWSTDSEELKTVQALSQAAHRTESKLAISLLKKSQRTGLRADWVLGDEVGGNAYELRNWCYERRQNFH
jgi:SRSO17 transposase